MSPLEEAALTVVKSLASDRRITIDDNEIRLAGELIQAGIELLDGHAKKHAAAAGTAAAAAITTLAQAEEAEKKP